jgi:streptogrisin C
LQRKRLISRRSRLTTGLTAGVAVILLGGIAAYGSPSYAAVPSLHTSLDPKKVSASIQYLTATYKVSEAEALRRLELQNDAQKLDATLRKEHSAEYGGMWLDQDHGGVLNLATTSTAAALRDLRVQFGGEASFVVGMAGVGLVSAAP